jgi:hypothetical protein
MGSEQTCDALGVNAVLPDPAEFEENALRRLFRRYDYQPVKEEYSGPEQAVYDAEKKLIDQFRSRFRKHVYQAVKILIASLIVGTLIDYSIMPVPVQVHGLVLNITGATIIALNTVQGRYLIAYQTTDQENRKEIQREMLARQGAITAGGMFAFFSGFLIQLIGVLFFP